MKLWLGKGWELSIIFSKWGLEKSMDSIGSYIRIGPILFEYAYRKNTQSKLESD